MPTNIPLSRYLPAHNILVPLRARTFKDALAELLANLVARGAVRDVAELERAVTSVRGRDIVSVGRSVALPHFRTDAVDHLVVSLGVAREPLTTDDAGPDTQPRVVALVLAPPEAATRYLQTVAALARFLHGDDVLRRLHAAQAAADVLAIPEFGELQIRPELTVRDLMMHDPTTVSPDTKARAAVDIMVSSRLRALPVVGDKREVLGVITEWDVMRALLPHIPRAGESAALDDESDDLSVREVMTRSVLCVSEEMGLEEAVNLMLNKKVEQCPVVHEGVFTGMLTRSDIIRKLFAR